MMTTLTRINLSKVAIEEMSRAKKEPDWVLARRLDAWHMFEETPTPAGNDELWRRTGLKDLSFDELVPFLADQLTENALDKLPAPLRATARSSESGALVRFSATSIRQLGNIPIWSKSI